MTIPRRLGYVRTSPADPDDAPVQLAGLQVDETLSEYAGPAQHRPQRTACITRLRAGDTLVVHSANVLAQDETDLADLLRGVLSRGACIELVKEAVTFRPGTSEQVDRDLALIQVGVTLLRDTHAERQRQGQAKARGVKRNYTGRPAGVPAAKVLEMLERFDRRVEVGETAAAIAAEFKVSRATLYTYARGREGVLKAAALDVRSQGQAYRAAAKLAAMDPSAEEAAKKALRTARHALVVRRKAFVTAKSVSVKAARDASTPEAIAAAKTEQKAAYRKRWLEKRELAAKEEALRGERVRARLGLTTDGASSGPVVKERDDE